MQPAIGPQPALGGPGVSDDCVFPLGPEAYREAAGVLARAFWDDPVSLATIPGCRAEERVRRLTRVFYAILVTGGPRRLPLCVRLDDRIVGVGIVHPPGTYPPSVGAQLALSVRCLRAYGLRSYFRGARWTLALERWHPKAPHYYLETLGVEPGFQGQGIGSAIVRRMTGPADWEHTGCYLESSKARNVPLYERHGFVISRQITPLGVLHWLMWRPVR